MAYMSVDRTRLQAAFALAHKASEDPALTKETRKKFKAVADLIWHACGESGTIPRNAGADLLDKGAAALVAGASLLAQGGKR